MKGHFGHCDAVLAFEPVPQALTEPVLQEALPNMRDLELGPQRSRSGWGSGCARLEVVDGCQGNVFAD